MNTTEEKLGWRQSLSGYLKPTSLAMLALGFSSGLPLLLVFGTLSVWLREAGVDRASIGFISWVALAYGFKWIWSPLVDGLRLPFFSALGRRRSWMLAAQLGVAMGLAGMAFTDPGQSLGQLVGLAVWVAFASATQDIVVDAYRIESAQSREQGVLAASYMLGYRVAMIGASAGVLWIADWLGEGGYDAVAWRVAYLVMAALMAVGMATTLLIDEVAAEAPDDAPVSGMGRRDGFTAWLKRVVVGPFMEFFQRYGARALLLLALIACYRMSDVVLGVIANVFYVDMGFSKTAIADVTKMFGVLMTLVGALAGGVLVTRFGVMRILLAGALLSSGTNLLFALLSQMGANIHMLVVTVGADNLAAGLSSAAFVAYLSGLTNVRYSASQYALFSSLMLLLPKFIGGFSGLMVDGMGYFQFFLLTTALGLPVVILILLAWRVQVEHWRDE